MSIPLCTPHFGGRESEYVQDCINTAWVSTVGAYVTRFEAAICEYTSSKHAVAVNSGTSAIHMALLVGGVAQGDEVIVPSMTFIATANAVRYIGAEPVFADCDVNYGLNVSQVIAFLESQELREDGIWNRSSGRRIKAVIPVHLYGYAVELTELVTYCHDHHILVIEDATESLGTFYLDPAGGQTSTGVQGDLGCFSFNGNKIITTGGGGMVVTQSDEFALKLRHLTTQAKIDPITYEHDAVGFNNRLTNLQAALGLAQLEQIESFIEKKTAHFLAYGSRLPEAAPYELKNYPHALRSNHWFIALQLKGEGSIGARDELLQTFFQHEIQVRPAWRPLHFQIPYLTNQTLSLETTESLWNRTICLPCSVDLTTAEIDCVIEVLSP